MSLMKVESWLAVILFLGVATWVNMSKGRTCIKHHTLALSNSSIKSCELIIKPCVPVILSCDRASHASAQSCLCYSWTHSQSYFSSRGAVLRAMRAILAILTLILPVRPLTQTNNTNKQKQPTKHHLTVSICINTGTLFGYRLHQ